LSCVSLSQSPPRQTAHAPSNVTLLTPSSDLTSKTLPLVNINLNKRQLNRPIDRVKTDQNRTVDVQ